LLKIAWGTGVWIADEPWNVIHFVALEPPGRADLTTTSQCIIEGMIAPLSAKDFYG
jgi:hypothetical protein